MTNPDKPNLNLIQMVQRARMIHDADAQPSEISGVYWIEAKPLDNSTPPTPRAGDWQIPTALHEVDHLWGKIKQATEAGELGYKARVSTSSTPGQTSPEARLILVCTYDAADLVDVKRVREYLYNLGFTAKLQYQQH